MVPHWSEKIAIGFHLKLVAQQLSCPMNVACVDAAWRLNRRECKRQNSEERQVNDAGSKRDQSSLIEA
tara:strand:+ start:511 stop:714 length:204 start_codon:yes stop_codon:yes gene_type:complete